MKRAVLSRRMVCALMLTTLNLTTIPEAFAQAASPDAIVGKWEADDGTVRLDMFRAGAAYQARFLYGNEVVEADGVTLKNDAKNPDPALRSRSLKNIVFITGLRYADGEWTGGSIYDASSGRTYNAKAEMQGGKLHLRGFLGVSLLGQTRVFHRMP
ncbi:DUF2147 domain-containing protein [Methylobacterium organophilum]|uniref:DUF2147 domain-containing protein n=1 Tax=Methylobacterium organophilum TaxID=410 RepID=A0ABQ4TDJ0_METOR|nr:DUF2147 domain-containing protein [Methylobacterium organophilum]UMY18365.1 DUF2147 domain-containing protein [Methylobacterium organophilum]GJE28165.1 hypothetical protein LKMONMHP_3032 [Methylobacterium organophilum]